MSNLDNWIDKINNTPGLSSAEKKQLRQEARELASNSGNLTSKDRAQLSSSIASTASSNTRTQTPTPAPSPTPTAPGDPVVFQPQPVPAPVTTPAPTPTPTPVQSTPTPSAVPSNPWNTTVTYVAPTGIKQATPDIVIFDESTIDAEYLTQAFFEEFGGTELINISRSDLIDGDQVSYSPIKNLSILRQEFNPNNIISIGAYQENQTLYGIDLLSRGVVEPYFDENGNLVIEIENVRVDESIEAEVATGGTINRIEL